MKLQTLKLPMTLWYTRFATYLSNPGTYLIFLYRPIKVQHTAGVRWRPSELILCEPDCEPPAANSQALCPPDAPSTNIPGHLLLRGAWDLTGPRFQAWCLGKAKGAKGKRGHGKPGGQRGASREVPILLEKWRGRRGWRKLTLRSNVMDKHPAQYFLKRSLLHEWTNKFTNTY